MFSLPDSALNRVSLLTGWRCVVAIAGVTAITGCEALFLGAPEYGSVSVATITAAKVAVVGVPLQLYTGQRTVAYGESDARGRYLFTNVPPGYYGVKAAPPSGFADVDDPMIFQDGLEVVPGGVEPVQLMLRPCMGTVAVSVRDVNGVTAEALTLNLYSNAGPILQRLKSRADGSQSFNVACGEYGVQLVPALGFDLVAGRGGDYVDALIVHRDSTVRAQLQVRSCLGTIRVFAIDASGAPVAGASLVAYTPVGNFASAVTDADGRYTFPRVPCGIDFGIGTKAPSGYSVATGRGLSFVDGIRMTNGVAVDVTFRFQRP